jgi:hypothetical protein
LQEFSADMIKKVAAEMSSLLGSLCPTPKNSSFSEASFSKEVQTLQKACDAMVEGGVSDEDGAMTILLGVQARINLLLTTNKSPQDLLLSSIGQIKASVEDHTKPTKHMVCMSLFRCYCRSTWMFPVNKHCSRVVAGHRR